jgi:hypothetical protein
LREGSDGFTILRMERVEGCQARPHGGTRKRSVGWQNGQGVGLVRQREAAEAKAVRRDERENTARGSKGDRKSSEETLTKASAKEDWQAMVVPDPAFYLKDNGYRK